LRGVVVAAVVVLGSCVGLAVAAGDPAEQGKTLYQRNCLSCHTLGGGDTVGPDLKGITERRDLEFVRRFIAEPGTVIAEGDPEVLALVEKYRGLQMPDLGLPPADVDAIVAYLQTQGSAPAQGGATTTTATETEAPATEAPQGDAATGEQLFTGEQAFENGGASCISCHTLAGVGALGGGKVGPDLTDAWAKYGGAAGFAAVLTNVPFPTMVPVYEDHQITEQEAASVSAYVGTSAGEEPSSSSTWLIVLLGAGVMALLLALAFLVWPRRRLVVRRQIAPTSALSRRR
jgi:mono/diheme cytochrome c family protein